MSFSSTLRTNRTVRLWTCCECHETEVPMTTGDCPHCQHSRCIDCGVKSHAAPNSDTEGEEMKTPSAVTNTENRMNSPSSLSEPHPRQPRPLFEGWYQGQNTSRSIPSANEGQPRLHSNNSLVINRVVDIENKSIFVMRNDHRQDKSLTAVWHDAIVDISSACASQCEVLSSIHLFRFGVDEPSSCPTIIVNSKEALTEGTMSTLQFLIRQAIIRTCLNTHQGYGTLSDYLGRLQLLFRQSRLRRTGSTTQLQQDLPPICEPRNRTFNILPQTGDSIGIHGSFVDTASLGCYLMVDSMIMALTVDHLLPPPSNECPTTFSLTHLSKQDSRDLLVPILNAELRNILARSTHVCELCAEITTSAPTDHSLSVFSNHFLQWKTLYRSCHVGVELELATLSAQRVYRAEYIGLMKERSCQRCVPFIMNDRSFSPGNNREMDWALFQMLNEEHLSTLRSQHNQPIGPGSASLKVAGVAPGALIKSLGRTSGHQKGQISRTASIVFHKDYVTYEWSVVRPPDISVSDWVEGGIGVDGDSGALIVDEDTNEVYGMLWGRTGEDATTVTLFTPMTEILSDIKAKMDDGCAPMLLRGQTMPPAPETSAPATTQVSSDDDDGDGELSNEFVFVSLGQSASSSPTYRLPSQPERYRSRSPRDQLQAPAQVIPRQLQIQPTISTPNLEPSPWLGSHTFFRYAVADEGE